MKARGAIVLERPYRTATQPPTGIGGFEDMGRYNLANTTNTSSWYKLPSGLWVREYDGSQTVLCTYQPAIMPLNSMTIMAWIYPHTLDASHRMIAKVSTAFGTNGWALSLHSGVRFYTSGAVQAAGAALTTNAWYLIAGTFDKDLAADQVKVYKNGAQYAVATNANPLVASGEPFTVATTFDGYMSGVRMYDYSLTADQMYSIYQNERGWFGV